MIIPIENNRHAMTSRACRGQSRAPGPTRMQQQSVVFQPTLCLKGLPCPLVGGKCIWGDVTFLVASAKGHFCWKKYGMHLAGLESDLGGRLWFLQEFVPIWRRAFRARRP